jgi:predicted component of type VI protein secretion system
MIDAPIMILLTGRIALPEGHRSATRRSVSPGDRGQPNSVDAAGDVVLLIEGDPRNASTVLEALAGQARLPSNGRSASPVSALKALKDIGVRISVDDFMTATSEHTVTVRAVIDISDGPIETPEQPDLLIVAGSHVGRGHYLKQPMLAEEFGALLEVRLSPTAARTRDEEPPRTARRR